MAKCGVCGRNYRTKYNHFHRFHLKDVLEAVASDTVTENMMCSICKDKTGIYSRIKEENAMGILKENIRVLR